MAPTTNDTTQQPRFIGAHARDRYLEWLFDDVRFQLDQAAAACPLDSADLHLIFVADAEAAYAKLATLNPRHLIMQAIHMAGYLNEITGNAWNAEAILDRWNAALRRRQAVGVAA